MPFIIADRVRETSTTVGTGSIALAGAVTGYQSFDAVLDTADTTFYTVADQGGPNWEVGIGTFTAPSTLARTTILSSSNGGSIVTFGSGTKDVFISLPASRTNVEDQPNIIEVNSASPALRITQTGSGNALLVEDSANPDSSPFVVDASGNVGIGTSAPGERLQVNAQDGVRLGASGAVSFVRIGSAINGESTGQISYDRSTGATFFSQGNTGSALTERMRIDAAGQVQVGAGSVSAPALSTLSDTNTGIFFPAADTVAIVEGGTEAMRVDSSANVLINTTTAVSRLTVNGDVSGTFFVNPTTVSANYTIPTNYNAMTAGPITVNSGVTVTVPSGSVWTVT